MCSVKFSPFTLNASLKSTCHKIQWLQFANENIVGRQSSRHSSKHFQIPVTIAISTLQLRLNTNYNFGLASTTICEHRFSKQNWMKSYCKIRLRLESLDALMQVSLCGLPMEIWIGPKKLTLGNRPKTRRALPLELMMIKCIM